MNPRVVAVGVLGLLAMAAFVPWAPATLATGISTTSGGPHPDLLPRTAPHPLGQVCSTSALCPSLVIPAYNLSRVVANSSTNGTGQTVVIVDACGDRNIRSDLATFDKANSLRSVVLNVSQYPATGTLCSNSLWALETALDVEWAHAIAPGASIDLIEAVASSFANLYGAWNFSLSHHLGNQISDSWSGSAGCGTLPKALLARAALAGVTVLAAAGDSGAWGMGTTGPQQAPADCTGAVTVGGTTLNVHSNGSYVSETAWSGSGGGYVGKVKEPSYQTKAAISDSYAVLGKPDVAAIADPTTGVWVYSQANGGWNTVGGTSVACPIWAAFLADANSWRASNAYSPLGGLDPYLYLHVYGAYGASSNYSATIHDVTSGSSGWVAGSGWDAATGVGTINGFPLARLLGTDPAA